jgi:hypothetical protein
MYRSVVKLMSEDSKLDNSSMQLKVDNQFVTEPNVITDAFTYHFKLTININYPSVTTSDQIVLDV